MNPHVHVSPHTAPLTAPTMYVQVSPHIAAAGAPIPLAALPPMPGATAPVPVAPTVHYSPHMPVSSAPNVQLVPTSLPDGRVVYTASNPSTPSNVIMQSTVAPPPLSLTGTPVQYVAAPTPSQMAAAAAHNAALQHAAVQQATEAAEKAAADKAAAEKKAAEEKAAAEAAAAPAAWTAASATRKEAEQWVHCILGHDLAYLAALSPGEFQTLINAALSAAKPPKEKMDARARAQRRHTEEWLYRALGVPRVTLRSSTQAQIDAYTTAAIASARRG